MAVALADVVAALGGELHGVNDTVARARTITAIAPLDQASESEISFLSHPRYAAQLTATRAFCVIVSPAMLQAALERQGGQSPVGVGSEDPTSAERVVQSHVATEAVANTPDSLTLRPCIVTPNPYLYFARLTQWWRQRQGDVTRAGVHPSAVVDAEATVHPTASIGPLCVVERGAVIGAGTVLKSRVTVGEGCQVGARCIVHAGVVIGADGFGFAPTGDADGRWEKIEQLGIVRIGDDVEIGANTCIDRGALGDTVIEDGVKLDNLIQIGHNVHIGAHSALAGCVGVAGSARIGKRCQIGGGAIVLGHLSLGDDVHISAATVVTRTITQPGLYSGVFPVDDNASWEKNAATLRQLHRLRERIKALEKSLQA